ncbi:MAG: LacI family transcriptional regulator, partial [Thermotoga sp.]
MNKITLKVIAEKLGVSISTVSRALTGKPGVSKGLRDKIIATAKNLGYYPDVTATGLRRGKTMTIGVLLPEL